MNILHLDDQMGWRGGEQQAAYLISRTPSYGHRTFVAGKPASPFLQAEFDDVISGRFPLPFRSELDIPTAYRLARICRQFDIGIVHAHTSHAHTIALLVRVFIPRVRVVVSRRVDFSPRPGVLNRWKYRSPDAVIAISDCIADVLRRYGVPAERLWTVHSGIDPDRLDVDPIDRVTLDVPQDAPLLCNVAALVDHKDQTTLLRAMPGILERHPRAVLLVLGEGPLRRHLEDLAGSLGIADSIRFLGYRGDVPRVLKACDLFVLSSKEEGLGTSILDAMAARIPVVATRAGGIPEMVRNGETGILCEARDPKALANAICRALDDPKALQSLVDAAGDLVRGEFSVDTMVAGNIRVYESVVGPPADRTGLD